MTRCGSMNPSDAPSESMSVTSGRCASSPALVSGLQVTPDEVMTRRLDRSKRGWVSSTARSGRANTSPTMVSTATRCRSTSDQTRAASRPASSMSTTVPPPARVVIAMNRPVPCISGQAGNAVPVRFPARAAATGSGGSVPGRPSSHNAT